MAKHEPFIVRRSFNAPRELVYQTMTRTEHLLHWWGPSSCRITVDRHDPRPGGQFLYCMHGQDGSQQWGRFDYHELVPHERIVFVNGFADADGQRCHHPAMPSFPLEVLITITLEEDGGRTHLHLESTPVNASDAELAAFRELFASMEQGFGGMYDKYAQYLDQVDTSDREVVIKRTLNAPRELVFEAFTQPEHLEQWWGPRGFQTTVRSMEVRPGGSWRFDMHGFGQDYPNRIDYLYVERPSRLIYRHGDDSGGPSPHDFLVTITFEETADGKTALTMRSVFPSVEALEAVKKFGAIEGGQQTIDRLEEFLKENQ